MKKDELVSSFLNVIKKSVNVEIYPEISEFSVLEVQTYFSLEDYFENILFYYKYKNKYDKDEILIVTTRRFLFIDKDEIERSVSFKVINKKSVYVNEKNIFSIACNEKDYFVPVSGINRSTILGLISFVDILVQKNKENKNDEKYFISVKGKISGPFTKEILKKLIQDGRYSHENIRIKKDHHKETWKDLEDFIFFNELKPEKINKNKEINKIKEEDLILIDGITYKEASAFIRRIKMGLKINNIFDFNLFFNLKPHQLIEVMNIIKFK